MNDEARLIQWRTFALQSVYIVASRGETFTSDDVWDQIELRWAGLHPDDRRSLGPIMRDAERRRWIEPTIHWATSRRRSRNHGPVRIWKPYRRWLAGQDHPGPPPEGLATTLANPDPYPVRAAPTHAAFQ